MVLEIFLWEFPTSGIFLWEFLPPEFFFLGITVEALIFSKISSRPALAFREISQLIIKGFFYLLLQSLHWNLFKKIIRSRGEGGRNKDRNPSKLSFAFPISPTRSELILNKRKSRKNREIFVLKQNIQSLLNQSFHLSGKQWESTKLYHFPRRRKGFFTLGKKSNFCFLHRNGEKKSGINLIYFRLN